jgi:hypothetical protein
MAIKYIKISKQRPSIIYPNWDFWFENKPSGNLARSQGRQRNNYKKELKDGFRAGLPDGIFLNPKYQFG